MAESEAAALKEIFNAERFRHIARETKAVYPAFDGKRFLALTLPDLDELGIMQRMRRMAEGLHATLPEDFRQAVAILRLLAPRINRGFVTLVLSDFVGLYGRKHFAFSLDALKFFTTFGSSEFAIREFLRLDLTRTLAVMEKWSLDKDEHVRRLASEGCRPRLPWSFRLDTLVLDPSPTEKILTNLRADPSLYVRKSVANHLNDITKDHSTWVLDRVEQWDRTNPNTAWIVKHALRTLIKKGDRRALAVIGAGEKPRVEVHNLAVSPRKIMLGENITMAFQLESLAKKSQRLVVDYAIHYVKKSGATSAKVFKLKELSLAPGEKVSISRRQSIRDFTTREHHPGLHRIDILINGELCGTDSFHLARPH